MIIFIQGPVRPDDPNLSRLLALFDKLEAGHELDEQEIQALSQLLLHYVPHLQASVEVQDQWRRAAHYCIANFPES